MNCIHWFRLQMASPTGSTQVSQADVTVQTLGPSHADFLGVLAGSRIRSGAPGTHQYPYGMLMAQ